MFMSKGTGDALAFAVVVGLCTMIAGWLIVPPAIAASVVWLISPRFDQDVPWLQAFFVLGAFWLGGNLIFWLGEKLRRWGR